MKFHPGRKIDKIHVPVTRVCDRQCPQCGAREQLMWYNKGITSKEVSLDELRRAGELIGPIDKIEITGGEPTLHSKFEELTNNLTDIFQCKDFMLVTNGWIFKDPEKLPLLLKYQRVYVSHYTQKFADLYGVENNTELHERIRDYLKDYPWIQFWTQVEDRHTPIGVPPYNGVPVCGQDTSGMISYYEGMLYGCCVAYGLPYRGIGIPLTSDWRDHLNDIELPCDQCFTTGPLQ
jgi:hypothetical protein